MKIYAYRVEQKGPRSLEEVLRRLNDLPFEDRFFEGGATGLRLDAFASRRGLVFGDIALQRTGHGPGRMTRTAALREIDLAEGESFGEDTGFVYDPRTGYMALQYNHIGPRIGRIQSYLFAADFSFGDLGPRVAGQADIDRCGFALGAVLRPDAYNRLRGMGIMRKLEFAVSLPGARAADRDAGRSLGQVLNAPLPEGVETLEVTIKAAPQAHSRLGRNEVMAMIRGLQSLGQSVKTATVRGRRDDDASLEDINLIQEQLEREALVTVGRGHRYPRDQRWAAIEGALTDWQANGDLQGQ